MKIVAYVPDLLDRSRFPADRVQFIRDASDLDHLDPDVVIVDLDRCSEPDRFVGRAAQVIGFGSHVDAGTLDAAAVSGFDEAMARSVFFRRLPGIITANG